MNRRGFLSGTVVASSLLPGCLNSINRSETEETPIYPEDSNLSLDFEVLGHECLAENTDWDTANEIMHTHNRAENRIEFTGKISDGDPKQTAYLQSVDLVSQSNELEMAVFTKESNKLEDCTTLTQYQIQVMYQKEPYLDFVVLHNGQRVGVYELTDN